MNQSAKDHSGVELDPYNQCLCRDGRELPLRPKTFGVLRELVRHAGHLVTKDHLLDVVWRDCHVSDMVLKVSVGELRKALADDPRAPRFIQTVHRRGYRWIGAISPARAAPGSPLPVLDSAPGSSAVVMRQMTRLQLTALVEDDRRMLEVASVAGIEFSTQVVASVLEQDLGRIEGRCGALARQGLFLRPNPPGTIPERRRATRFQFIHAVHREVLYQSLSTATRALLHPAVGAAKAASYDSKRY